jgi:hypothetical protein
MFVVAKVCLGRVVDLTGCTSITGEGGPRWHQALFAKEMVKGSPMRKHFQVA